MSVDRRKIPWSRGDKAIMVVSIAAVLAALAFAIIDYYNNSFPLIHIPPASMPNPNGYELALSAGRNVVTGWPMRGSQPPPPTPTSNMPKRVDHPDLRDPKIMAAADALVGQNRPGITALEASFSYPFKAPPIRSFYQFADIRPIIALGQFLRFEAEVKDAKGDLDGACRPALDAVRLGTEVMRGGEEIHESVGTSCQFRGRETLWDVVGSVTSSTARRTARTLEAIDASSVPCADVVQQEEWTDEASLLEVLSQRNWKRQFTGNSGTQSVQESLRMASLSRGEIMRDLIAQMDARVAAAKRPYGTPVKTMPSDPAIDTFQNANEFDDLRAGMAYNQAQNRLLMTAFALRAYKLDHGSYPSTLQALAPSYLRAVPVDPFTAGAPLIYRNTGKTYLLYSVGPDMKDDGGKPIGQPRDQDWEDVSWSAHGDVVAGVDR